MSLNDSQYDKETKGHRGNLLAPAQQQMQKVKGEAGTPVSEPKQLCLLCEAACCSGDKPAQAYAWPSSWRLEPVISTGLAKVLLRARVFQLNSSKLTVDQPPFLASDIG
ncbi:unnamed protein product [Lota lota]